MDPRRVSKPSASEAMDGVGVGWTHWEGGVVEVGEVIPTAEGARGAGTQTSPVKVKPHDVLQDSHPPGAPPPPSNRCEEVDGSSPQTSPAPSTGGPSLTRRSLKPRHRLSLINTSQRFRHSTTLQISQKLQKCKGDL